jgi:hypothetical protein
VRPQVCTSLAPARVPNGVVTSKQHLRIHRWHPVLHQAVPTEPGAMQPLAVPLVWAVQEGVRQILQLLQLPIPQAPTRTLHSRAAHRIPQLLQASRPAPEHGCRPTAQCHMQQAPAKMTGNSVQPMQPQSLICKPPQAAAEQPPQPLVDQQSIIGVSKSLGALRALLRRGCSPLQRVGSTSGDRPGGRRHRRRGCLHPATARPRQPGALVRPQGLPPECALEPADHPSHLGQATTSADGHAPWRSQSCEHASPAAAPS